jgi:DNA repair protein RecO (recombination protein O)
LTDTSLIVHWLTAGAGRITTVAKGARQPKSPFAGKLDLAFECDFSFQRARRGDLHLLREVTLTDSRPVLRTHYNYLTQLAYAVALLEQITETDTPIPEVCALFAEFLDYLPRQPAQPRSIYALELKLLASQGLEPDLSATSLPPAAVNLVQTLLDLDWPELAQLRVTAPEVRALRQFLHGFLIFHCGKLPRGRAEALSSQV